MDTRGEMLNMIWEGVSVKKIEVEEAGMATGYRHVLKIMSGMIKESSMKIKKSDNILHLCVGDVHKLTVASLSSQCMQ